MRVITDHQVSPGDRSLQLVVTDEPGAGGANHRYEISGFNPGANPSGEHAAAPGDLLILFQNGTTPEMGSNGVTIEVLIAVCMDRLRSFQAGKFACNQNACALQHLEEALHWLQQRTISRMRREVEGTHVV